MYADSGASGGIFVGNYLAAGYRKFRAKVWKATCLPVCYYCVNVWHSFYITNGRTVWRSPAFVTILDDFFGPTDEWMSSVATEQTWTRIAGNEDLDTVLSNVTQMGVTIDAFEPLPPGTERAVAILDEIEVRPPGPGVIQGSVLDMYSGTQPPGVIVELHTCAGTYVGTTHTDSAGGFTFANVPAGDYYLILSLTGYRDARWPRTGCFSVPPEGMYVQWQIPIAPLLPEANLAVGGCDFGPEAPIHLRPGGLIALGAYVENVGGSPADSFWLEVFGSRTGGLTLDEFLVNSQVVDSLASGAGYSFLDARPLYSIPDGPYTVVFVTDRTRAVPEWDECDNRAIVRRKRLLVLRPQTNVDLTVENFSLNPNPAASGEPIQLGGHVRNTGTQASGPFWIEFWGSWQDLYPHPDFFLCESISVSNLEPGHLVDLSHCSRTLYPTPSGTFWVGCFADRPDHINELDETNNYRFVPGHHLNYWSSGADLSRKHQAKAPARQGLADLTVAYLDFTPWAPTQSKPGDLITIYLWIANRGFGDAGPFWLEFFGSRLGGLENGVLLMDLSERVSGLGAGQSIGLTLHKPLMGVPDGPYTVVAMVDRLEEVPESNEANNRLAVAGKRILAIRSLTGANLVLESFLIPPEPLIAGQVVQFAGTVRNSGSADTGKFWIEFWGSREQCYPQLDFMLCDSIPVANLAPAEAINLADYARRIYTAVASGSCAIGCFVDRADQVNETDESDNYQFVLNSGIGP